MLKELHIKNLVLVENATIFFSSGFNVISGESGAGKSVIMNALNLIAGERSDSNLIRKGTDKATIQAVFDISLAPDCRQLLFDSGIDSEAELIIRRELSNAGKSRAFINHQPVQLFLLKQLADLLFKVITQHANQKLFLVDYHKFLLDLYGGLSDITSSFSNSWEEQNKIQEQILHLKSSQSQRLREIDLYQHEIEEIENANIKNGEDEELFSEYTQLSHAEELDKKVSEMIRVLADDRYAALPLLARQKTHLEQLSNLDPTLQDVSSSFNNAFIELQEVYYSLRTYLGKLEKNPERADKLSERLALIAKLKKKYGPNIEDIHQYLKVSHQKLKSLENSDLHIEELEQKLKKKSEENDTQSLHLTSRRKQAAQDFETKIVEHLQALNMPKTRFHVQVSEQKRNHTGNDRIEFFLAPNTGELPVSLCQCASGGEISRTMIALQTLLAGKEHTSTLFFDEVDANIGGETAKAVGEKLKALGNNHQVICITHFPQVAQQADHHLNIYKKEIEGRTVTFVQLLDHMAKQKELIRMQGG